MANGRVWIHKFETMFVTLKSASLTFHHYVLVTLTYIITLHIYCITFFKVGIEIQHSNVYFVEINTWVSFCAYRFFIQAFVLLRIESESVIQTNKNKINQTDTEGSILITIRISWHGFEKSCEIYMLRLTCFTIHKSTVYKFLKYQFQKHSNFSKTRKKLRIVWPVSTVCLRDVVPLSNCRCVLWKWDP